VATSVQIISGGATYHLHNSNKVPTAGGALTAASTTPLVVEDDWRLTAVAGQVVTAGGPPFRIGSTPLYTGYGNTGEEFTLLCYGSSHDNVASIKRTLYQAMNTALYSNPATLMIQPDGATSAVYFEVYRADIQEEKIRDEDGYSSPLEGETRVRLRVRLTRSAFGGRLSSGESLMSSQSFGNTGTGTPDNIVAYSTGSGDLIYEGSPLNVEITTTSGPTSPLFTQYMYAASVYARAYDTGGAGAASTSSTTGTGIASATGLTVTAALTNQVKLRIIARVSAIAAIAQLRYTVSLGGTATIYGPWTGANTTSATLLDLGGVPLAALLRRTAGVTAPVISIGLELRSTTGASASVTLTYREYLLYYTFAAINSQSNFDSNVLQFDAFPAQTGAVCLPYSVPYVIVRSGTDYADFGVYRGTLPRYYAGASLYLAAMDNNYVHDTAWTYSVTTTHAPLYYTLRGAG
jgi:hypothetical protein